MRFLLILPAVCPRISWPFSSRTRNIALGSSSTTCPRISRSSSLANRFPLRVGKKSRSLTSANSKMEGGSLGGVVLVEEGLERLQELQAVLRSAEMVIGLLL